MNRNLDGCYFRIMRMGKCENVCFSDLTEAERESVCRDRSAEWYKSLAYHLADSLRRIGDALNLTMEDLNGKL